MLEKDIVRKIRLAIKKEWPDAFIFKVHGGTFQAGIPDLIASVDGYFVGIEVKRPETKNTITPLQQANIEQIIRSGGIAFVSWDAKDAVDMLKGKLIEKRGGFY